MTIDTARMSVAEAEEMAAAALRAHDVADDVAACVAAALVAAEIDGQRGHGFSRVAAYCAQARSGKVAGRATPTLDWTGAALARIDARDGFAFPAIARAIEALSERAPQTGVAAAAIHRSHHCGQLGAHVEKLAERGLVAIMVANAPKAIAPWGGGAPLFGTNPIAFAAPMENEPPLVIDLSLSKVARGKVMAAAQAGEAIPEGWALDAQGEPTTDPKAALAGAMIPMGDAKGAALALMVETLAATLTGANHSYEASSFFDADGPPPGVGQTLIAFDPERSSGGGFAGRMRGLAEAVRAQDGTRLPGAGRRAARRRAAEEGVEIPLRLKQEIDALAS